MAALRKQRMFRRVSGKNSALMCEFARQFVLGPLDAITFEALRKAFADPLAYDFPLVVPE